MNYDGKVKSGDATQILKYVALKKTLTAEELLAADVKDDGKVKSGDATQILKSGAFVTLDGKKGIVSCNN